MIVDVDDIDILILRALQKDGGLSAKDVGIQVGLSQSAAWRRIKNLEMGRTAGWERV